MNRVAFVVDGFNVYHSLLEAQSVLRRPVKWLDLRALCASYTRRDLFGRSSELRSVSYFSADAGLPAPSSATARRSRQAYVTALRVTGVKAVMSRFKPRSRRCPSCGARYVAYEEKETDVAIALEIVELARADDCDSIVIVSGDTDILPALRAARAVASEKAVLVGFPYRRFNHELRVAASRHFKIRPEAYARHQLPNPVVAPDGARIYKPESW